jgi:hypothetical protein
MLSKKIPGEPMPPQASRLQIAPSDICGGREGILRPEISSASANAYSIEFPRPQIHCGFSASSMDILTKEVFLR